MYRVDCMPRIIGAAIQVHRRLGPGLLKSAYEACPADELERLGLIVQRKRRGLSSTKQFNSNAVSVRI